MGQCKDFGSVAVGWERGRLGHAGGLDAGAATRKLRNYQDFF
jgi:hypothetical protein